MTETMNITSLESWLEVCAKAGVPHVPAYRVCDIPKQALLHFDTSDDLVPYFAKIEEAKEKDHMLRWDCCAEHTTSSMSTPARTSRCGSDRG